MELKTLQLTDLKPADYNPRKISDKQLEMLKKALVEFGDLSGIVFNRRTGNLIGGHQRIKCLPPDARIEKTELLSPSRTGTVAHGSIDIDGESYIYREVDWPLEKEKAANIAANKHGGEFDDELLAPILKELSEIEGFDIDLTGFDRVEIENLVEALNKHDEEEKKIEIPELIEVIITCDSEEEQKRTYEKLTKEGYKCRLLTL